MTRTTWRFPETHSHGAFTSRSIFFSFDCFFFNENLRADRIFAARLKDVLIDYPVNHFSHVQKNIKFSGNKFIFCALKLHQMTHTHHSGPILSVCLYIRISSLRPWQFFTNTVRPYRTEATFSEKKAQRSQTKK